MWWFVHRLLVLGQLNELMEKWIYDVSIEKVSVQCCRCLVTA